jgi:hypothetical protein
VERRLAPLGDEEVRRRAPGSLLPPVPTQPRQQRPRQRDAPVDAALAVAHPDQQAVGVDVAGLQREPLPQPQPECVDGGEGDAAHRVTNGSEQCPRLAGAEHHRERPRLVDPEQAEDAPLALQRVQQEEPQRVDREVDARRRELPGCRRPRRSVETGRSSRPPRGQSSSAGFRPFFRLIEDFARRTPRRGPPKSVSWMRLPPSSTRMKGGRSRSFRLIPWRRSWPGRRTSPGPVASSSRSSAAEVESPRF